jgi:hypothetical protein
VAAAEPASWDQGTEYKRGPHGPKRGELERIATRKALSADIHPAVASTDGTTPKGPDRLPRKCKFAELTGCTGSHPPWLFKAFGDKAPIGEEENHCR